MTNRTRADSPTKVCTALDCDRPLRARGLCAFHYRRVNPPKKNVAVECPTCGEVSMKRDTTRRFCSLLCRDVWRVDQPSDPMYLRRPTRCALPPSHPVMVLIRRATLTERECPGCGCLFTPLSNPLLLACSNRCKNRIKDRRRRARLNNTECAWVWSDFMRVAAKFGYSCAYCGIRPTGQLDPDHVVPLSKGGDDSIANLLPSCRACNCDKRDVLLADWNADRLRRGLAPRTTSWVVTDRRFTHLTSTLAAA